MIDLEEEGEEEGEGEGGGGVSFSTWVEGLVILFGGCLDGRRGRVGACRPRGQCGLPLVIVARSSSSSSSSHGLLFDHGWGMPRN